METLEIQKLIQQSRRQDSYAFSLLVRQYQDFVFRLAFRLLCNYEEAQDITQETFIRVWTHLPQFNLQAKFTTWLYKITVNLCYDSLRSYKKRPIVHDSEIDFLKAYQQLSDENLENKVMNEELIQIILYLTQELTPKQKLIFTLWDLEGLEAEEVKDISGLSSAKIKSNLYLAHTGKNRKIKPINPMDKYNAILNKLQHTAPIVTDPEGLTQRIMKEIEQPVIRRRSKIRIIMTGIAASVLSVWMIDEINYRPVVSPTTKTEEINRPPDNADRSYIPAELSSQEKRTIFYSELKSRMNKQQKIKQLIQKIQDYETK